MTSAPLYSVWMMVLWAVALLPRDAGAFESSNPAWTTGSTLSTEYIFRGVKLAGFSAQPWVDYTAGPLTAGLWSNVAIDQHSTRYSDPEIDFYGSYTFASHSGAFNLVPGFTCYAYPNAGDKESHHPITFEPSLAGVFSWHGVQFTPKVYYDVILEGATFELTSALAVPLKSFGTELDFSATAGTYQWRKSARHASQAILNEGDYWSVGIAVPVQISFRSKVTAALSYSDGRNNFFQQAGSVRRKNPDAGSHVAFTLGYSLSL